MVANQQHCDKSRKGSPRSYFSPKGTGLSTLAGKHQPQANRNQAKGNPAQVRKGHNRLQDHHS